MQPAVVITEPINEKGIMLLEKHGVNVIRLEPGSNELDLWKVIAKTDALITRGGIKITHEMMEASPRLKIIGVHGIGCDHIDLSAARKLGKVVCNTPDALTVTVSEMTLALLLSLTRRIVSADKATRAERWERKYKDLIGIELAGKTVGIIGLGRIGVETARRLKAFDTQVIYYDVTRRIDVENNLNIIWVDFPKLLSQSDIISLHVPANKQTYRLIGAPQIALMKKGSMIINTSRGSIIDEKALITALSKGHIAAAALDVFEKEPIEHDNPLINMDNVILTPHLGASSLEAMQRMATQVAQCVLDVIENREPSNIVV